MPYEYPCTEVKSSLGLPIGSTVRSCSKNGIILTAFESPHGYGPQYSLKLDNGEVVSVHQNNVTWVAAPPKDAVPLFKKDDRVKFIHNGKTGIVYADQIVNNNTVVVTYDRGDGSRIELAKHLILLHSPAAKAAGAPHPMQATIDAIEEERRIIKLRVAADQQRLGELSKAKELLARG